MLPLNRTSVRSIGLVLALAAAGPTKASEPEFRESVVLSGLDRPTVVRAAPDGRLYVAEVTGMIRVFDPTSDSIAVVADLTERVFSGWDRGLLGLALDPGFPANPYLYALYTYDAPPGQTAPVWNDECASPPGYLEDGCVVDARLSRLTLSPEGDAVVGEKLLIGGGWCQQFPSHSIGTVTFGEDGALYVGAGDGASFQQVDYGQFGGSLPATPTGANPCDDPPSGSGGVQEPPDAEGGALRSQDLRSPGDPVTLDGAILRVDPSSGEALPDNPLAGGDPGDDRIIAYGLRNPYRFTTRPGTSELWIGDVGWVGHEEIDRILDPTDDLVENFGWPCFEGGSRQPSYEAAELSICEELYRKPSEQVPPFFSYTRAAPPHAEDCEGSGAAVSALAFSGAAAPVGAGALFFGDVRKGCLWVMLPDPDGLPDPENIALVTRDAGAPVHLEALPSGDLLYVDFFGEVRRLEAVLFSDGFESGDVSSWGS